MIPKKIHYCWVGNVPRNERIKRCMESWQRVLPDYEIIEWNENSIPIENKYCTEALKQGLWSKVSNFIRLYALQKEGGVYLDTDFEILKRLDPLLMNDCFLGFQRIEPHIGWATNGILGATKNHPFLHMCLERTQKIFLEQNFFILSPRLTTLILKEMGLREYGLQTINGVTIYPKEYFYPYAWYEQFTPDCITENTYAVHHWEGSWIDTKNNSI